MTDHAMTSSRRVVTMPPWATDSQPWNRGSRVSSVQQPSLVACSCRRRPCSFSSPHAKHRWGSNVTPANGDAPGPVLARFVLASILLARFALARVGPAITLRPAAAISDVKVLHLPGLGLDEVLARRDLL